MMFCVPHGTTHYYIIYTRVHTRKTRDKQISFEEPAQYSPRGGVPRTLIGAA